jgi:hypothetical protein
MASFEVVDRRAAQTTDPTREFSAGCNCVARQPCSCVAPPSQLAPLRRVPWPRLVPSHLGFLRQLDASSFSHAIASARASSPDTPAKSFIGISNESCSTSSSARCGWLVSANAELGGIER